MLHFAFGLRILMKLHMGTRDNLMLFAVVAIDRTLFLLFVSDFYALFMR
jgi:hypothetical protein